MVTLEDLENDLTRNFMPASEEERDYLKSIAWYVFKHYLKDSQPKPTVKKEDAAPIPRGASWNTNPKRLNAVKEDMKKITTKNTDGAW